MKKSLNELKNDFDTKEILKKSAQIAVKGGCSSDCEDKRREGSI